MKKFDRLPPEERKAEIRQAAAVLFVEKGFSATTMENIVEKVSLSKGGVYRLYPSLSAILKDLMIEGMHLRNAYYEERVKAEIGAGKTLSLPFFVEMIADSLLLYPEISAVYVEFLWEKRRDPELQALYEEIVAETEEETGKLIREYGADEVLLSGRISMGQVTEMMNSVILSLHVLNLWDHFREKKEKICASVMELLLSGSLT